MTSSDNRSGNQGNQWGSEDWRLLIITFVGSLAALLAGAGMLGLAVALARVENHGNNITTWIFFIAVPVGIAAFTAYYIREKDKDPLDRLLIWLLCTAVAFFALVWIGVAAGIK